MATEGTRLVGSLRYRSYEIDRETDLCAVQCAGAWRFVHDAYDGPGDHRHGNENTIEACIERIDDLCAGDEA